MCVCVCVCMYVCMYVCIYAGLHVCLLLYYYYSMTKWFECDDEV